VDGGQQDMWAREHEHEHEHEHELGLSRWHCTFGRVLRGSETISTRRLWRVVAVAWGWPRASSQWPGRAMSNLPISSHPISTFLSPRARWLTSHSCVSSLCVVFGAPPIMVPVGPSESEITADRGKRKERVWRQKSG
jgi:hypothetical protein